MTGISKFQREGRSQDKENEGNRMEQEMNIKQWIEFLKKEKEQEVEKEEG